jgi:hypothetical protein
MPGCCDTLWNFGTSCGSNRRSGPSCHGSDPHARLVPRKNMAHASRGPPWGSPFQFLQAHVPWVGRLHCRPPKTRTDESSEARRGWSLLRRWPGAEAMTSLAHVSGTHVLGAHLWHPLLARDGRRNQVGRAGQSCPREHECSQVQFWPSVYPEGFRMYSVPCQDTVSETTHQREMLLETDH